MAFAAAALAVSAVTGAAGAARAQAPAADAPLSIESLTRRADVVVVGEVASIVSEWNATRNSIVTRVEVRAREVLKGEATGGRVTVQQLGGRVGEATSEVAGAPTFTQGEGVLLFLARGSDGHLSVAGLFQGKFSLERDAASGGEVAVRRVPGSAEVLDRLRLEQARADVVAARGR